ncbi:MAG: beta strand repeat-containing protein [Verrucomicrobiota bacterium]
MTKKATCLLSVATLFLAGQLAITQAANIAEADVTTTLWPSGAPFTFFDSASTGGADSSGTSLSFDRSFGTLNTGSGGTQIIVSGIGWASAGSSFTATNVIATITYLGANGTNGGGDDVVIGKATNNVTANTAAGEWTWVFDAPLTNTIDGASNLFRINMARVGTGNLSFKGTTAGVWSTVKLSVAGSTTAVGSGDPLARKWVGGIDGAWDTSTKNWSDGVDSVAYADGKNVTLDDNLSVSPLNNYITLAGTYSPSNIVVNNSLYDYHLSGGGLAGDMTLTKQGSGTLFLSMSSSFTGDTTINGGILEVDDANALGSTNGGTVVNSGSSLALNNGITLGEPLTLNGNGTGGNSGALRSIDPSSTVTVAGPITLGSNARITCFGANVQLNITSPITDNGSNYTLLLTSAGGTGNTISLNSANNVIGKLSLYTYRTTYGLMTFGVNDVAPAASLTIGGGLFDLNGTSQTFAGLLAGSDSTFGVITNSSATPSTLTIDYSGTANSAAQSTISGNVNLVKTGTGPQSLGGGVNLHQTYSGTTTINGGILGLASDFSGVTNEFIVNSGGTLRGNNTTIGGSVTVKSGATFYAGFASNALGTLTLDKDLTLEAGSLTIAAINPELSPSSDVINVNGTLHYGGTLVVYSIGHTNALMAGETFTIFPGGGLGSFDSVIFNSIETQPGTTLSFDGATGVVTVTATTAPSLNVAALGGGLMQINWDSSFYKLQWQTNALSTGLNLNWTDYPTTNKASVNVTNDLTIPATFFRLAPLP